MHLCMRPGVWACLFLVMGQCQYARDSRMSNFLRATLDRYLPKEGVSAYSQ